MRSAASVASSESLDEFFRNIHLCREKNALTHGAHPYPAKFIPHIPRLLIETLAPPRGLVLDPMCGSGTALVEATVGGRNAVGVDLNPVAVLAARAKTVVLSDDQQDDLRSFGEEIDARGREFAGRPRVLNHAVADDDLPDFPNRDKWFAVEVSKELAFVKRSIRELGSSELRTVALCAFSAIIVPVSRQESETRWCAKRNVVAAGDTSRRFRDRLTRNLDRLLDYRTMGSGSANVVLANARRLPLSARSVDFVVTSPPYANSHDYYLYNKLRLFWLDEDVARVQANEIGSRHRHSDKKEEIGVYVDEMTEVLSEVARVMKPSSRAAIVVADAIVRGELFEMDAIFADAAGRVGLRCEDSYRFSHQQFNAAFQRGFGSRRPKSTHVLILRKDSSAQLAPPA